MPLTETGYAPQLANFATLVATCESMGSRYSPSRPALSIQSLCASLDRARAAMAAHHQAQAGNKHVIAEQAVAFEGFYRKLTRVLGALKSSESPDELDREVQALVNRSQGVRIRRKTLPTVPSEVGEGIPHPTVSGKHTVSHSSDVTRLDTLDPLVKILSGTPEYAPNEEALRCASLVDWHRDHTTRHEAVIRSRIALDQARDARRECFAGRRTGLRDLAADTKAYIRSVFGTQSPQFQNLAGLSFR